MIPYKADVPMTTWPLANFALIALTVLMFPLVSSSNMSLMNFFILCNGNIVGFVGHLLLHGDLMHLVGNMVFLWVFGNAICAKFGNGKYLVLYLVFGLVAATAHWIFDGNPAVGASGAINGVVGAFLLLYPLNSISVFIWFFGPRFFSVSSYWLILYWLAFDIYGAVNGGGRVAYMAHLGGFAAGVTIAYYALTKAHIQMREDEISLLDYIKNKGSLATTKTEVLPKDDVQQNCPESNSESHIKLKYLCESCNSRISGSKKLIGKKVKCPKCSTRFIAQPV